MLEQSPSEASEARMVVDDQHADAHARDRYTGDERSQSGIPWIFDEIREIIDAWRRASAYRRTRYFKRREAHMRRAISLAAAIAVAAIVNGAASESARSAATLCVGATAGCFASIQAAVAAAGDGDTMVIGPGAFAAGSRSPEHPTRRSGAGATTIQAAARS